MIAADLRRPLAFATTGVIVGIVAGAWSPPGPVLFLLTSALVVAINVMLHVRHTRASSAWQRADQEPR